MSEKLIDRDQEDLKLSRLISLDDDYSFIFESLEEDKSKVICATKPLTVFDSLEQAEDFLLANHNKYKNSNAGIAGYINYEGDLEFAFYEEIHSLSIEQKELDKYFTSSNKSERDFELKRPEPKSFCNNIKKCQGYIKEGDIYQANISHKYTVTLNKIKEPNKFIKELYQKLRQNNPAPYSGLMNFKNYQILSSSPESLIKIQNGKIYSSPIKGTADLDNLDFLIDSAKDKAEHIMIVDLERNDLGRICETGSVTVEEMLAIYKFKNLYHYISTISGTLKKELYTSGLKIKTIFDAIFPGGSITGAPKIRAMQIIQELEKTKRGPYTGSMGYLKYNNGQIEGEFNILIRSLYQDKIKKELCFHSGCGITAYSDPSLELAEANLKAEKLIESLL